jgi:SynChlorMet cassette protein ScmA
MKRIRYEKPELIGLNKDAAYGAECKPGTGQLGACKDGHGAGGVCKNGPTANSNCSEGGGKV